MIQSRIHLVGSLDSSYPSLLSGAVPIGAAVAQTRVARGQKL